MQPLTVGALEITRVVESELPTSPRFLFAHARPEHFAPFLDWLAPRFYDPAADRLWMAIQTFVVRTPRHTVLVDTCLGNDKPRSYPDWNQRRGPFLADLKALGVDPARVDYVLCTHLHVDHVGWNTRLQDGRWVPTFPNARYLFGREELAWWQGHQEDPDQRELMGDSVTPILEAGLAERVEGDFAISEELRLEPTPGHTPGHVSLHLASGGSEAVITGDMLHHPIQIALPDWCSRFCNDPARARQIRRAFLERYADRDVKILGTHFATPCWGRVVGHRESWRLQI